MGFTWIRLDFGSYSDVRAKSRLILIIMVYNGDINATLMIQLKGSGLGVGYSVSGYVERTETLALQKELGSWSDVTGSARCWSRVMVKCEILTKGLGLALVTLKLMVSAQGMGFTWIRLDFGSYSDVRAKARLILIIMVYNGDINATLMIQLKGSGLGVGYSVSGYVERTETLALQKELGSWSDVTGSARCWSRVMVKCEILTKGLGLELVRH
ncbi:Ddb1- And Cul4-Associated Factor 4-Like Protein 2 [Manis pentadactyla]|nr:Ddb1- And Cul4-Associated Factor 4-Like Protein 2 [Manis pentadactyla]